MSSREEEFLNEQEIYRLKGLCSYEIYQNHGDFLKCFLQAFLRADPANARILLPAMQALEKKHSLKDLYVTGPVEY